MPQGAVPGGRVGGADPRGNKLPDSLQGTGYCLDSVELPYEPGLHSFTQTPAHR